MDDNVEKYIHQALDSVVNQTLNDIEIIDHIIVAPKDQFSFEESGILSDLKKDAIRKFNKTSSLGEKSSNYKIM